MDRKHYLDNLRLSTVALVVRFLALGIGKKPKT